jgi:hypothetical protein
MKKLSVLIVVFTLLLSACDFGDDGNGGNIGAIEQFWAGDFTGTSTAFYQIEAELLAANHLAEIWAERDIGMSSSSAQAVLREFTNNIHGKMMSNFGWTYSLDVGGGVVLDNINTMEWANWLITEERGNEKLTILFLNIKDGFVPNENRSFVGGYIWTGDFFEESSDNRNTNERVIVYINANPLIERMRPGSQESFETIVHEMQHIMNFASSFVFRQNLFDTWIDEGLSESAVWLYRGSHNEGRIGWYNEHADRGGRINRGNNFFAWGSHDEGNAILDDYATVYLFFQWLRLQSGPGIFSDISASERSDRRAVLEAFNAIVGSAGYGDNWGDMLKDWYAANYTRNSSGRHGYGNDVILNSITRHYFPGPETTVSLFPGEGVFSKTSTTPPIDGNIRYFNLTNTLLTYNASTNRRGGQETGTVAASVSASDISSSRNILDDAFFGPYAISAGDMLRRNNARRGAANSFDNEFNLSNNAFSVKVVTENE